MTASQMAPQINEETGLEVNKTDKAGYLNMAGEQNQK
jgi:hypothetical protein